jgi:hypothetical protein
MTSQGWNWSLLDAKAYVAKYGKLNIGQMYIPTDGKSHWICYVPLDAPVERWNTEIQIGVTGGSVNWQIDDGATSTASGNISVTFPSVGWHDVKISAPSGVTYYPYCSSSSKTNEQLGKIQKTIQIFLGDKVTSLGNYSLRYYYSLTSITIPDSVTSISSSALSNCYSLTSITIPDSVTSISNSALNNCYSLTSITISDSVTSIGSSAFSYCYSLTSISIPDSVASIGSNAFNNCFSLKNIIMESSTPPTLSNTNAFGNLMNDYSIIVPAGSRSTYTSTSNWSSVSSHIVEASS